MGNEYVVHLDSLETVISEAKKVFGRQSSSQNIQHFLEKELSWQIKGSFFSP